MIEILKVQGMSRGHCVNSVETGVGELEKVSSVAVDLKKGEVVIDHDTSKTSINGIQEAIQEQGDDVV